MTNRVFFLGAGASHASEFRLPLMRGFFDEEYLEKYPSLKTLIRKLFSKKSFAEVNMESFITHLEMSLEGFGASWNRPTGALFEAQKEFTSYVVFRLSKPVGSGVCQKHLKLFEKKDEKDTILSLNYDSIVENVLFKLSPKRDNGTMVGETFMERSYGLLSESSFWDGTPASLYQQHQKLGYFISLHGSINWVYCPNEGCHLHGFFFPNMIDHPTYHYLPGDPCQICGSGLELVIVPPTMMKAFKRFPKFGFLWNLAFRKLVEAAELVMIGMSLPDSDYYLKWLIKEAMLNKRDPPQLTIVNPNQDAIERTKALIGVETPRIFSDLDEFITNGLPST